MTVDETSNGQMLTVATGESLEICLGEIRTTDYQWLVEDCGEPMVSLESERFYSPRHLPMGKHIWSFRATAPGDSRIRICYRHTWDGSAPLRTFEVALSVVDVRLLRPA